MANKYYYYYCVLTKLDSIRGHISQSTDQLTAAIC